MQALAMNGMGCRGEADQTIKAGQLFETTS